MTPNSRNHNSTRGAALITALALLMLFTMLGAIWFHEMTTDNANTDLTLAKTRAQLYANAGIYARLADLHAVIESGNVDAIRLDEQKLPFSVYAQGVANGGLQPHMRYRSRTTVTVSDENARININHAPPKVLRRLLGVDGRTARAIRASLPVPGAEGTAKKRWLTSVDELVTRGFMTSKQLNNVNTDLITVYTVSDATNPKRFINVNTAAAPVLQAVLDLRPQQATGVIEARPFYTTADLVEATGKEAALFNTRPPESTNKGLPPELTFESSCFRIVAVSELLRIVPGRESTTEARARTEAVIQFDANGHPNVQYWSEAPER